MKNINKWQLTALSLIAVNVITVVVVLLTISNVIWFNIEQRQLISDLMQDRSEYINSYQPFEGKE